MNDKAYYKYHYVYRIDLKDGRFYIGSRSCNCRPEDDIKYFGSSDIVQEYVNQNSISHITKSIISIFFTSREAKSYEAQLIFKYSSGDTCINPELNLSKELRKCYEDYLEDKFLCKSDEEIRVLIERELDFINVLYRELSFDDRIHFVRYEKRNLVAKYTNVSERSLPRIYPLLRYFWKNSIKRKNERLERLIDESIEKYKNSIKILSIINRA